MTEADDVFTDLRPLLFAVAYDLLGSSTDADDVLQDCYLRWRTRPATEIEDPRAYLVSAVSRTALNHLRAARRRRESYVGNWLPEPIRTDEDASRDTILAESISFAMLLVLETLSPVERVVFVLHEVFDYPHADIAAMVEKSEPAVRQIAHRAREHVRARRPRFEVDHDRRDLVADFLHAAHTGDVGALLSLLDPDVVQISDGGGQVAASRHPIVGAERVARFSMGLARTSMADARVRIDSFNGAPAAVFSLDDTVDSVAVFEIAGHRITHFYAIRNPDKLTTVDRRRRLTRQRSTSWRQ
ncbi:RNA polymerase sigma-70 factor [Gordonia sp. SID5947]|uniref:RNA polymerase sigma-70 factor n=1 Tax=Gordonia sp. SID5947 TaxID=2690315 RepID=UPI0031BA761E